MKEYIKIDQIPKKYGRSSLTAKEKEARIYALAESMKIKIGGKDAKSKS